MSRLFLSTAITLCTLLALSIWSPNAFSQEVFHGTVQYQWISYESADGRTSSDHEGPKVKDLVLTASPSETGLLALNDPDEGGIYINHDDRELFLETKKGEALRITESEYSTFVSVMQQMFGLAKTTSEIARKVNPSNSSPIPSLELETKWEKTGNTKRVHGYDADEWIIRHDGNTKTHLWLANGVDLEWGFVAQHSASLLSTLSVNGINPAFLEQNRGLVLELTVMEDEDVLFECIAKDVAKKRVNDRYLASSRLKDARVMSLTEFMMRSLQGG